MHSQGMFLNTLGQLTVGRGINKADQTPSERAGIRVAEPKYFGVQAKNPIPYQRIVGDEANLRSMLQGFAAKNDDTTGQDTAHIIQSVLARSNLIGEAFDVKKTNSIYANVPPTPEVNLYNIQVRNQRRDNLFSIL